MPWYHIDQKLLTIKVFYFLTLAAIATLIPYLPIILSQIGVQQTELGFIYGLIFFLTFFKNVIIGFVADKYQLHKVILILSCILTGPLYATLLAVPSVPEISTHIYSSTQLQCLETTANITNSTSETLLVYNASIKCLLPSAQDDSENRLNSSSQICLVSCPSATNQSYSSNASTILMNESQDRNSIAYSTSQLKSIWTLCNVSYNCSKTSPPNPPYTSHTFWLCLTVGLLAALCGSNELMMNDAIAISVLGDDRAKWGRSRLWGSAGYAVCAILVGFLIEGLSWRDEKKTIDYTPAFFVYLVLSLTGGVVAYFHPTGEMVKSSQVLKGVGKILRDVRVLLFLSMMLVLGFYNGIMMTYGYLYLRTELGAPQICMSLCVLATVVVECPILFIGGKIVNKIGAMPCLYLALLAYCIKFLAYAYIPSPWWAILVETTHMFTFGLMFTAANMRAGEITSKGYTSTMIGLINGIKWGLGLGLGSVLGGNFASSYSSEEDNGGYKFLFKVSAISCAVSLVIYVIANEIVIRFLCSPAPRRSENEVTDVKLSNDGKMNGRTVVMEPESEELLVTEHNGVSKVADQGMLLNGALNGHVKS